MTIWIGTYEGESSDRAWPMPSVQTPAHKAHQGGYHIVEHFRGVDVRQRWTGRGQADGKCTDGNTTKAFYSTSLKHLADLCEASLSQILDPMGLVEVQTRATENVAVSDEPVES